MNPLIKICGLTTAEAVAAAAMAEYIGFVFYSPSPRHISSEQAAKLAKNITPAVVAVTVDADDALLSEIKTLLNPAYFQLHGSESPERVIEIRQKFSTKIIKAISIASLSDVTQVKEYQKYADMLLFDAKSAHGLPGGNGVAFDWSILSNHNLTLPWFLSGGLGMDNIDEAVRISGAKRIDVSSSLESSPGVKDPVLIREFIHKARLT